MATRGAVRSGVRDAIGWALFTLGVVAAVFVTLESARALGWL